MPLRILLPVAAVLGAVAFFAFSRPQPEEIVVSAAASLTDALQDAGREFTRLHPGVTVRLNFGASGALQRQIERGAPVDVFAPASPREMDSLQRQGLIEPSSRIDFAQNRLVLIAPLGSDLDGWEALRSPSVRRVAISQPEFVPAGRYAWVTLSRKNLWDVVREKAIFGENARQTLTYVAGGDADAGIVFATDARIETERVRVVAEAIPGRDHEPILYPAAVLRGAPRAQSAREFVAFLQSPEAQGIFARYGFMPANERP